MRRNDGFDVFGSEFDQDFVKFVECDLVVLAKGCFKRRNVLDYVAAFLATLALAVHPQSDDLGIVAGELIDVGILVCIGHSLQVIEIRARPRR